MTNEEEQFMPIHRTSTGTYRLDEIVVDAQHDQLVLDRLKSVTAGHDTDPVLGLTRLQLVDLGQFPLRADLQTRLTGEPSVLDRVLFQLREEFREEHHGWTPTMAKVRMYAEGTPYTGGGAGDPERLAPGERVEIPARASTRGRRVRVGILDCALYRHPQLDKRYLTDSAAFEQPADPPPATLGHAVYLSGIVLQRAPGVELVVRQALDGSNQVDSWTLARTMAEFSHDVDILLTSLGGATWDDQPPFVLERAEARLGCLHVASAGNWGNLTQAASYPSPTRESTIFPAALPGVIAVGALDEAGERAAYSQSGPWVDLMAPGRHDGLFLEHARLLRRDETGVLRPGDPVGFDGVTRWEGTSAAAAYVAGGIAAVALERGVTIQEAAEALLSGDPYLARDVPAVAGVRPYAPERDGYR
ncbi:S8/S53 family peptidase [Nonomuraea sp. NPDC005983]|uniref:S8 family peptidase n=1 Tax=Nonomuraea sp. NPDC005983 TaxID=3155595 RepID=UPI0033BCD7D9